MRDKILIALVAVAGVLSLGHFVDHFVRGDVPWPLTAEAIPFILVMPIVYFFTVKYLPDWWVFSLKGFTVLLMVCTAVGLSWAGRRYRRLASEDPQTTDTPGKGDVYALGGLTLLIAAVVALCDKPLELKCQTSNKAAVAFYERLGFVGADTGVSDIGPWQRYRAPSGR